MGLSTWADKLELSKQEEITKVEINKEEEPEMVETTVNQGLQ